MCIECILRFWKEASVLLIFKKFTIATPGVISSWPTRNRDVCLAGDVWWWGQSVSNLNQSCFRRFRLAKKKSWICEFSFQKTSKLLFKRRGKQNIVFVPNLKNHLESWLVRMHTKRTETTRSEQQICREVLRSTNLQTKYCVHTTYLSGLCLHREAGSKGVVSFPWWLRCLCVSAEGSSTCRSTRTTTQQIGRAQFTQHACAIPDF